MAPELLQWNESTKIGSAADIFSLGATIFELAANVQMPNRVLGFLWIASLLFPQR